MEPYYSEDGITIFHGDCLNILPHLPKVDLVLTDPPYGIGNFIPQEGKQMGGNFPAVDWNDDTPPPSYFKEMDRVSVNRIVWGANYYNCFEGFNGAIVWNKNQFNPKLSHCEIASTSTHKRVSYVEITCNGIHGDDGKRVHPCQKPVALYKWLLQNYAKEGDKILDTHGGSFSSAIACNELGFEFDGCELDEEYFDSAVKRFQNATKQYRLEL